MKKVIVYVLLLVVLVTSVAALEEHKITYLVGEKGVEVIEEFKVNKSSLSLLVPEDAYNFDLEGVEDFRLEREEGYKNLSMNFTAGSKIKVNYFSDSYLERGDNNYFSGLVLTKDVDKLNIRLVLPEGSFLARPLSAVNPPVNPKPSKVETTGEKIIILWQKENVRKGENIPLFVVYEGEGFNWSGFILILVLIIFVFIYVRQKKRLKQKEEKQFPHLLEKEKKIVENLLKAKDNTMWQKELQIATDFTKSRLSRTLRSMEERDLIEKIPHGNTNKIKLILEK